MRKYSVIVWLFLFYFLFTSSCKIEDISPDEITNELKLTCYLANNKDTTSSKEVWVGCTVTNSFLFKNFNCFGHCWSYNLDELPTVKSGIRNPIGSMILFQDRPTYNILAIPFPLFGSFSNETGIPVLNGDSKLIIRGFAIFNDTLIRYSIPLVLNNPFEYAY